MRKTVLFSAVITLITLLSATKTQAQDSKILVGGGLAYATDISSVGFQAKGVYAINSQLEVAASFTYFLPKKAIWADIKWYSFDIDGHYVFSSKDQLTFYGLAGINILMVSIPGYEYGGYKTPSTSDSNFGFNIGAGTRYGLSDSLSLVGEAKYAIASGGYFQIGAGVLFEL